VADPKILKTREGAVDKVSAPSSFIANAHNELCAFCTEKGSFLKKYGSVGQGAAVPTAFPPLIFLLPAFAVLTVGDVCCTEDSLHLFYANNILCCMEILDCIVNDLLPPCNIERHEFFGYYSHVPALSVDKPDKPDSNRQCDNDNRK